MYLFFDTETTGLPKSHNAPIDDVENWPRLVQLAYLYYSSDGKIIEKGNFLIRPDGYSIPAEASRVHGITTERALSEGKPVEEVLLPFYQLVQESEVLIGHNLRFDESIVGAEFYRLGLDNPMEMRRKICTMESTTNLCKIPGRNGYKWPRLSELHKFLFGSDFENAHDASTDIVATARCFWELRYRGLL